MVQKRSESYEHYLTQRENRIKYNTATNPTTTNKNRDNSYVESNRVKVRRVGIHNRSLSRNRSTDVEGNRHEKHFKMRKMKKGDFLGSRSLLQSKQGYERISKSPLLYDLIVKSSNLVVFEIKFENLRYLPNVIRVRYPIHKFIINQIANSYLDEINRPDFKG